jgi:hypothetical protein
MMTLRRVLTVAAGVAILWMVVLAAIHFLHFLEPTAASTAAWAQRQNWSGLTSAERARRLAMLADQMNQLSFAERQKLFARRGLEPLTKQMTDEERLSLMDQTMTKGFAQVMDAINRMKPEDRRRMVEQALENMKKWNPPQDHPPALDNAAMQKVIQTGFSSYLQNASAASKLDLAPLIEQIQINMQGMGN